MFKHITILLVLVSFLASCSKDNPVTPNGETFTKANAGSTYTYDDYSTDTTSGQPIAESRDTTVMTVLQTGLTFGGKSNVMMLQAVNRSSTDTAYVCYESNNDFSVYNAMSDIGGMSASAWSKYPTGSKTTSTITIIDTTIDFFGTSTQLKITLTTSYVGEATQTIKGQSVKTLKIKQSINTTMTILGVPSNTVTDSYVYVAPSLGFLTKSENPVSTDAMGAKSEGSMSILFDYNLK